MEVFTNFIGLVVLAFGILQIILFFKLWRMTDDVRTITRLLSGSKKFKQQENVKQNCEVELGNTTSNVSSEYANPKPKFKVGMEVLDRNTMSKLVIMEVGFDGYLCSNEAGEIDRIYDFDELIECDTQN